MAEALQETHLPFCVASNGPVNKIKLALGMTGLLPHFSANIFSAYEIKKWKPEPDPFLYAARFLGFSPSVCAVVEDSVLGVQAGVAVGMHVFGYCGDGEEDLLTEQGAYALRSTRELPKLLTSSQTDKE